MPYAAELTKSAAKEFWRLSAETQLRITGAIDAPGTDPRPPGCEVLQRSDGILRIRIGDFRVLYRVNDDERVLEVLVVKIGPGKNAYRYLKLQRRGG